MPYSNESSSRRTALSAEARRQVAGLLSSRPDPLGLALSQADARRLAELMDEEHFEAGAEIVFDSRHRDDMRLMLILQGDVSIETTTVDGHPVEVLSAASVGATLGKINLLCEVAPPLRVTAAVPLVVASLSRRAIRELAQSDPALCARLLASLSAEIALHNADAMRRLTMMSQLARALESQLQDELRRPVAGAASAGASSRHAPDAADERSGTPSRLGANSRSGTPSQPWPESHSGPASVGAGGPLSRPAGWSPSRR